MYRYFLIYKPYGMLSQFTREGEHNTLADLEFTFPKDVYPVGRLDADSEGLLIHTNDKRVNSALLDPGKGHRRTYLVQVEGSFTEGDRAVFAEGMILNDKGKKYRTLPADVRMITEPPLPPREPPVRFRKNIPTSWIEITLTEGKNRQVRKMTAAAGFPALRLVRTRIESLSLKVIRPGRVEEIDKNNFYRSLRLGETDSAGKY